MGDMGKGNLKLIPVFALSMIMIFSVIPSATAGTESQFCDSIDSGDWSDPTIWDCNDGDATDSGVLIHIGSNDIVTADVDVNPFTVVVELTATLIVNSGVTITTAFFENSAADTIENNGTIVTEDFTNDGTYNNNCGSSLTITNDGENNGEFNNFGTFVLEEDALFDNTSGTFNNGGILNILGDFQGNDIIEVADQCQSVGGTSIPIDQTALLLAGVQSISMWMIPVVLAGVGIGVFVIMKIRK